MDDAVKQWANGKLLAQVESNGAIRVAHSDELGKILALTDNNGAFTDEYAYQPYGRMIAHSGTNDLPFAFMGDYGVWNAGSGLSLTRHRAYDANLMRFLQSDPMGIDGGRNLYAYGGGNPLFWLDPLGLLTYQIGVTGNAGIGTGIGGSAGVAVSLSWNQGLQFGYYASAEGGGHFGGSAGIGIEIQASANGQISHLGGTTLMLGGEGGVLGLFGANQQYSIDGSGALPISSVSYSPAGVGGDVHSYVSQTWVTKPLINVPNYAIMAWDWIFNDKQEQQPCK